MNFSSPKQLKDWISNMAKQDNLVANTVLQNYMMERFLERVSLPRYIGPEMDCSFMSDEACKEGWFTGAMVGLCSQDMTGDRKPADFDWFEYRV